MPSQTGGHIEIPQELGKFAMVPGRILEDTTLSFGARMLYGIIIWLAWRQHRTRRPGYAGQQALADEFGCSRRSVGQYLAELQQAGYLRIHRVGQGQPDNLEIVPLGEVPSTKRKPE